MEFKAISKFVRISPRKTMLVADLIRNKRALDAQAILKTVNKRAAFEIGKTLDSALSNAKHKEADESSLWVSKVLINGGPMYKRYMPRAMGRATPILHRTSHIVVMLSDEKPGTKRIEEAVEGKEAVDKIVDDKNIKVAKKVTEKIKEKIKLKKSDKTKKKTTHPAKHAANKKGKD